jgi:hypothetical protein
MSIVASEIVAVDDVTTLPAESSNFTTGWLVKTDSDAPATGDDVTANCVAIPGPVGVKLALVPKSESDVTAAWSS